MPIKSDKKACFKSLPKTVFHVTNIKYLSNILKNGLTSAWIGDDADFCNEMCQKNHPEWYENGETEIVCLDIPKSALDMEKCDFEADLGSGTDEEWSGTFIYRGTIRKFRIYAVDDKDEIYEIVPKTTELAK